MIGTQKNKDGPIVKQSIEKPIAQKEIKADPRANSNTETFQKKPANQIQPPERQQQSQAQQQQQNRAVFLLLS